MCATIGSGSGVQGPSDLQEGRGAVDDRNVEVSSRAVLRELRRERGEPVALESGVNAIVTGSIDAAAAREIVDACRSSRAEWTGVGSGDAPGAARITRSELELRAARVERTRAAQARTAHQRHASPDTSEHRVRVLEARV